MATRRLRFQVKPNTRSNSLLSKTTEKKLNNNGMTNETEDDLCKSINNSTSNVPNAHEERCDDSQTSVTDTQSTVDITNSTQELPVSQDVLDAPESLSTESLSQTSTKLVSNVKPPVTRARLCKPKPKIIPRLSGNQTQTSNPKKLPDKNATKENNLKTVNSSNEPPIVRATTHNENAKDSFITTDSVEQLLSGDTDSQVNLNEEDVQILKSHLQDHNIDSETAPTCNASSDTETGLPAASSSLSRSVTSQISNSGRLTEPVKPKRKPPRKIKPGVVPPEKSKMKMMDLIFWNPLGKGMTRKSPTKPINEKNNEEMVTEEDESVDNPDAPDSQIALTQDSAVDVPENTSLPGPRVIIGEDGQITIDESSLVIEQTSVGADISSQEIIYDASDTTYASFKKPKERIKLSWTLKETAKFYKTLSVVGTDFTLMSNLFPERSRIDLKNKFKKEERCRKILVDKAISEWHNFDLDDVEGFLKEDTIEQALKLAEQTKEKRKSKKSASNKDKPSRTRKAKKKNSENSENSSVSTPIVDLLVEINEKLGEDDANASVQKSSKRTRSLSPIEMNSLSSICSQSKKSKQNNNDANEEHYMSDSTIEITSPQLLVTNSIDKISETINHKKSKTTPSKPTEDQNYMSDSTTAMPSPQLSATSSVGKSLKEVMSTPNLVESENVEDNNQQLSSSHPTLHSLLNKVNVTKNPPETASTVETTTNINLSVGQLILVASRTPTNEQVVHVYLVSPNGEEASQNTSNTKTKSQEENISEPVASTSSNVEESSVQEVSSISDQTNSLKKLGIVPLKSP